MKDQVSNPVGLDEIGSQLLARMETLSQIRDRALNEGRQIVRLSANSIRAVHRQEFDQATRQLEEARAILSSLTADLIPYPGVYWAGSVQDSMKEFAEAALTLAIVNNQSLPTPAELNVEDAPYLNAMAESASELRRQVLDALRSGDLQRGEQLLSRMDEIYGFLVTVDFPDGLTGGLRRSTDSLRAVLERTRGDLTVTGAQNRLLQALGASAAAETMDDSDG